MEPRTAASSDASCAGGTGEEVGDLADRFEPGQDVGAGVGKEDVGVEKIRPGKHVIHRVPALEVGLARGSTSIRGSG